MKDLNAAIELAIEEAQIASYGKDLTFQIAQQAAELVSLFDGFEELTQDDIDEIAYEVFNNGNF